MDNVLLLVAGGVIAALSAWVAAWITNRGADGRLKTQLEEQARQRELEHNRAVYHEPIEVLRAFASEVARTVYFVVNPESAPDRFMEDASNSLYSAAVKARAAMTSIADNEARGEVTTLLGLILDMGELKNKVGLDETSEKLNDSLALIDGHVLRLKLKSYVG